MKVNYGLADNASTINNNIAFEILNISNDAFVLYFCYVSFCIKANNFSDDFCCDKLNWKLCKVERLRRMLIKTGFIEIKKDILNIYGNSNLHKPKDIDTCKKPTQKKENNAMTEKQFNEFWNEYPRKIGKKTARYIFMKLKNSVFVNLITALKEQKEAEQWNGDIKYIPHPSTWLNGERWDDVVLTDGFYDTEQAQELTKCFVNICNNVEKENKFFEKYGDKLKIEHKKIGYQATSNKYGGILATKIHLRFS